MRRTLPSEFNPEIPCNSVDNINQLIITYGKPYKAAKDTLVRWIKVTMTLVWIHQPLSKSNQIKSNQIKSNLFSEH